MGDNMTNKILRLPAVKELTGLSRSSIYLYISKGEFPAPVPLSVRSVGWLENEVNEWIEVRVNTRHKTSK